MTLNSQELQIYFDLRKSNRNAAEEAEFKRLCEKLSEDEEKCEVSDPRGAPWENCNHSVTFDWYCKTPMLAWYLNKYKENNDITTTQLVYLFWDEFQVHATNHKTYLGRIQMFMKTGLCPSQKKYYDIVKRNEKWPPSIDAPKPIPESER
jgi:hypothetical protein